MNVNKKEETMKSKKKREDITLSESNNDSSSCSNDSSLEELASLHNQVAPIYSNFPITEFYSVGLQGNLPKELYNLSKHILDLDIEVSPVNAYYKNTTMPDIQQKVV